MKERIFISNDIVVRKRTVRNRVVVFSGHANFYGWWIDTGYRGSFVKVGEPKIVRKTSSLPANPLEDHYWFSAICTNNPFARYEDTPHYNKIAYLP